MQLFRINRLLELVAVVFFVETVHMKHKLEFAVKADKNEDISGKSVDFHGVCGNFNSGHDNVDPHMGNKVVGHMHIAGVVCVFCIVGAHKVEQDAIHSVGQKCGKVVNLVPKKNERSRSAGSAGDNGKCKTAGLTVKVVKSAGDNEETEEIKKMSHFGPSVVVNREKHNKVNREKHKAHTHNYPNCAFEFKLVLFHKIKSPKNTFILTLTV